MMEVLKSYFKEKEVKKVKEKIEKDVLLNEKYKKIKNDPDYKLTQLQERIEKTEDTFETRFKAFKKAVLEAEKNLAQKTFDAIEQEKIKAKKVIEIKKEELFKEVNKKIEEKTGIAGKILSFLGYGADDLVEAIEKGENKESGFMDKILGFMAGALLSWLGFKNYKDKLNIKEEIVENVDNSVTKPSNNIVSLVEKKENIKNEKEGYYKIGKVLVKNLLNDQFASKNDFGTIVDKLKTKKYSELKDVVYNEKEFGDSKENFEKAKKNLLGGDMQVLYDNILTEKNIDNLLKQKESSKILNSLGINFEKFNWRTLTIEQLFIVFSLVVSFSIVAGVKAIPGIGESILDKIFALKEEIPGFSEIKNTLNEGIKEFEENVIDKKTIKEILNIDNISEKSSYTWKLENFKNVTNKEKIKEILSFRDYIKKDIVGNKKYNLGKEKLIEENLAFKDILELFITFKGEKINNDNFKSSLIYAWIVKVLDKGTDNGGYIKSLGTEISKNNSDILEEDEQKLLKVILKKIIDKAWLDGLLNKGKQALDAGIEHLKKNPDIIAWAAGLAFILRFTPAGKVVGVLYAFLGKKGMSMAVLGSVFAYLYNQLDDDIQSEIQENKGEIKKQLGIDVDEVLKKKPKIENKEKSDKINLTIEKNQLFLNIGNEKYTLEAIPIIKALYGDNSSLKKVPIVGGFSGENNINSIITSLKIEKIKGKEVINVNNDYFLDISTIEKKGKYYYIKIIKDLTDIKFSLEDTYSLNLEGFRFTKITN